MKDYKLELMVLRAVKSSGAFFEFEKDFFSEIDALIDRFEHPEALTNADRETALMIFRDGYKNMENRPMENWGQMRLMFALCAANLELELKQSD